MATELTWMDRPAMIQRGKLILDAHWRNRLEACQLDIWFERNVSKYCAYKSGVNVKPSSIPRMNDLFWMDVSRTLEKERR